MLFEKEDKLFLQRCQTSVVLPTDAESSLDDVLGDESDVVARSTLYFDENLRVLFLLDIPPCSEQKLDSYLSNIELRVDAWASAVPNGGNKSPTDDAPAKDLIASVTIDSLDDPFTVVRDNEGEVVLQLIWETHIDLARPRFRAQHQTVTFLPIATILSTEDKVEEADILEPFTALEFNVLEPLSNLSGAKGYPYLPASHLERFAPPPSRKEDKIRLRHVASDPLPTYAVVMPRLKYSRIETSMSQPSTIASLDLDMVPVFETEGSIEAVDVSMASGRVVSLIPISLPVLWKSKDCFTLLYDLHSSIPQTEPTTDSSLPSSVTNMSIDTLSISILITVRHSTHSTASIRMSWDANVDFSLALNPSFGAPSQPLQRTNRPSSLKFGAHPAPFRAAKPPHKLTTSLTSTRTASTNLQYQVIPTSIPRSDSSSVMVSFIAPVRPAHLGVPFTWKVVIVNNSLKSIKLAIVPLPRIHRPTNVTQQHAKRHAPKASDASHPQAIRSLGQASRGHTRNSLSTAKAVVDEQVLYALHHQTGSAAPMDTDLVSLTAELRIGPLGIGQCYETELQFVAYKSGSFTVDAVRIVDLVKEAESGVGTINDIRDLPDIFVLEDDEYDASKNSGPNNEV